MSQSSTYLFVHYIWATWDRAPLISLEWEECIYSCIRDKCLELKCEALAIGGVDNHIHVLTRMHPGVAVSELAKAMKGASSHLITHEIKPAYSFKWQGGYGALSVSRTHVRKTQRYVNSQKEHHAEGRVWDSLEMLDYESTNVEP